MCQFQLRPVDIGSNMDANMRSPGAKAVTGPPTIEAKLLAYRSDFLTFASDLIIPSAHGQRRFGDVMAPFQVERFGQIAPALYALAKGEKPPIGRYWWEATKGASKDSDLAVCLLWLLAFAGRSLLAQVGAADQDQADELRKAATDILRLNPWLGGRVVIQNWKITCTSNGATAEIVAADTAGSHGARPDVLIINELSHITKQEVAENWRDNADKVPQGLVVIATNAGFMGTWQYRWREIARTSPRWVFNQRAEPSPWIDPADLAEAERRNSKARFRRLWWGVWSSGTGDALDSADIEAAVDQRLGPMQGDEPGYGFVAGLDLGIKQDHSAHVVLGYHTATQRCRLALCQSWGPGFEGKVDLMAVEASVMAANKRFGCSTLYDPHQAGLMAQRCQKHGAPMVEVPFVGSTLNKLAAAVLDAFRSRAVDLYPEPKLLADLNRLTIVEKSYGYKLEATHDADGHADRATALALALLGARERKPGPRGPLLWVGMMGGIYPNGYGSRTW
ncbi:MAG TPA: hypothetical protein VHY91_16720 [Pirellulales bacterium]|nr:hypothetical protein [Pirellulales bacterium]